MLQLFLSHEVIEEYLKSQLPYLLLPRSFISNCFSLLFGHVKHDRFVI